MRISRIVLRNYKIYHGENELVFPESGYKNVFIVSGNNGFGKTTLLTSLIWGLYGKSMVDVDEKFRREIYDAGGYKKFGLSNLNHLARAEYAEVLRVLENPKLLASLSEEGKRRLLEHREQKDYSVAIYLTDLDIPGIPCREIAITRTFNTERAEDRVSILIDGKENELTKEVGPDIFINDFILPKEIAKFFFFDAEKIVALAEMRSLEDKRALSRAYSEVLGIKKYEDLQSNLEEIRVRFRKNAVSAVERKRLDELQREVDQLKKRLEHNEDQIKHLTNEKELNKQRSEQLQEKLIREGNSISLDELADLKKIRSKLSEDADVLKSRIKDLLDIAPFAIMGESFSELRRQHLAELELKSNEVAPQVLERALSQLQSDLRKELEAQAIEGADKQLIMATLEKSFHNVFSNNVSNRDLKVLLSLEEKESHELDAIYNNLKFSFSLIFKQLSKDVKNNRIFFNKIIRKISLAESKENDLLIKEIRSTKNEIELQLRAAETKLIELNQEIGALQKDYAVKLKLISELAKKAEIERKDQLKDEAAERLIKELSDFIGKFRQQKKNALGEKLRSELNRLMHKKNLIKRVEVQAQNDILDIFLFDKYNQQIFTESFSKGEQQLYATALLKALVDESNIKFPVFIDSPLQKFDKKHSINIIRDFYPSISDQVVLFPLLEKELSELEFNTLLPKVNRAYLINNINDERSTFTEVDAQNLFKIYQSDQHYVYND